MNGTLTGSKAKGHPMGIACDFYAGTSGGTKSVNATEELYKFIVRYCRSHDIRWGEIIIETNDGASSRWIHFAYKNTDNVSRSCRTRRYNKTLSPQYVGEAVDGVFCFNSPTYCGR